QMGSACASTHLTHGIRWHSVASNHRTTSRHAFRRIARERNRCIRIRTGLSGVQRIKCKAFKAVGRIREYVAFGTGGTGKVSGCFAATYSTEFEAKSMADGQATGSAPLTPTPLPEREGRYGRRLSILTRSRHFFRLFFL